MDRLKERMATARQALKTLEEVVGIPEVSKIQRDAGIQRFEYTFEATWKAIQLYLHEAEGLEVGSPKGVVRVSLQVGLLDEADARQAMLMSDDRNQTAHTYNEPLAVTIYGRLAEHAAVMARWLDTAGKHLKKVEGETP
jgi:nucleotidyltransferase substrate binding protein (TIGR01987 family)